MTARERRIVRAAAVILAGAGILRLGGFAVETVRRSLHDASEAAVRTSRVRALVAEGPARQALLRQRVAAIVSLAPALLGGSSAADAGAAMAGELNALAARHRVAVARFDPMPDSAPGMLTPVRVRIQGESDLAGIHGFIHGIETGPLLFSITDLTLSTQDPDSRMERLRLDATVVGWMTLRAEARNHQGEQPDPAERRAGR